MKNTSDQNPAYNKRNIPRYAEEMSSSQPMATDQVQLDYTDEQIPQIITSSDTQRYLDSRYQQSAKTQQPLSKRQQFYLNQQQQLHQMFQNNQTPVYVPPFLVDQDSRPLRSHHRNAPFDYLPWSIANIFLCVIIAMPALFFSIQTRDLKRAGDVKQAKLNSKRSLILNIVASIVGVLTIMLALILRFALYQLFVYQDVQSQNVPLIAGG